ncbi:phospholipase D-like domain-containing protein [Pseudonocardia xinjiangensis]|uniref:phospholipase D n=1 Tax=Pseudonocardia xinjiangensis TaxID=75289 RepID=A0ABX1RG00_9PSEU|nr:phospholipase D-like domain-containing protein [Pseudonocardia xinjiangensis]NMH78554.1 phospholipase [Pseudonocardia xinjiangensis]
MGISLRGVELHLGPSVLGAPDDLDAVIRAFIDGAQQRLLVAVQELDSRPIAEALLAAAARPRTPATARGTRIRVQVILESSYLTEEKPLADPWTGAGDNEANRTIYAALLRAGIDVITDLNPEIFHQKFVVRDPGTPTAAVLTGSTNFTRTDTGTNGPGSGQAGNNLNHVVVLHGKKITDQYLAEFERLRSGTFGDLHERHEPRPREMRIGSVRIKPLFAPRHGPEMEIMKQMLKAEHSVEFAMFTFARSSGIDDTMVRLVGPTRRFRGVLDRGQGAQKWAATAALKAAGVELFHNVRGNGVRKVHHKLMVIDDRLVIIGSFNYTAPATTLNDENIVVIGDLEEADPDAEADQRRLAAYARSEIDRIVDDLAEPV